MSICEKIKTAATLWPNQVTNRNLKFLPDSQQQHNKKKSNFTLFLKNSWNVSSVLNMKTCEEITTEY